MSNLIKKPYELDVDTKLRCLIYGQAGMGKTTLALSTPSPLLLDFDNGVHRINFGHQCPTVQITRWEDCVDVLHDNLNDYETIVVDTLGKLLDYMGAYIIRKNPKYGKSNGALTLQGFGERKAMFRQFKGTVTIMKKHLVCVAHRDTLRVGEDIRYVPMVGGSSYDDIVTELDLVGYLEAVGKRRTLTFDPSDRNDGKNTCNLPSVMELPIVVDEFGEALSNTYLTDYVINPYIQNLEKRKAINPEYNAVVAEMKEAIALITDAQSANDFVGKINNFKHIGSSKAWASQNLAIKTKNLGLVWNAKDKAYVAS